MSSFRFFHGFLCMFEFQIMTRGLNTDLIAAIDGISYKVNFTLGVILVVGSLALLLEGFLSFALTAG